MLSDHVPIYRLYVAKFCRLSRTGRLVNHQFRENLSPPSWLAILAEEFNDFVFLGGKVNELGGVFVSSLDDAIQEFLQGLAIDGRIGCAIAVCSQRQRHDSARQENQRQKENLLFNFNGASVH